MKDKSFNFYLGSFASRLAKCMGISMRRIEAVLFDMDGLVLDTEKLYARFWREGAAYYGYEMTWEQALGMRSLNREAGEARLRSYFEQKNKDVFNAFSYQKIREKRIELMNVYIENHGVDAKPGIVELLDYLDEKGIKKAIVTSSPLERTKEYLSMVQLDKRFDELISGYMVERGKPEPDIYIYAAEKLGVETKYCLVLEDSPAGILSAKRAGCLPVLVPDLDKPDEDTAKILYGKVERLDDVITTFFENQ